MSDEKPGQYPGGTSGPAANDGGDKYSRGYRRVPRRPWSRWVSDKIPRGARPFGFGGRRPGREERQHPSTNGATTPRQAQDDAEDAKSDTDCVSSSSSTQVAAADAHCLPCNNIFSRLTRRVHRLVLHARFLISSDSTMADQQGPDAHIQPDERYNGNNRDDDEGAEVASSGSSLTSITSSVLQGQVDADGRVYAVFGREEYGMPMDDAELDRIDMCHAKYFALLDKKRFLAPITENPQQILDLGCGTGIWSIDVADAYPSADVLGVDIAPTQPEWVPPNCRFELDDIEQDWAWKENSFDLIFARDLILSMRNWPRLIDQAYKHLKPGGWVEFQCVTGVLRCDDNTLPEDSPMRDFSKALYDSTQIFGTPIDDPFRWKGWFEERGFEDVTEVTYKLPCNPWPKDPRLKLIGAFEMENLLNGLSGMVTRLFSKTLKWSPEQVQVFLVGVRKELKNRNVHCYWPFQVVYARKPGGPPRAENPAPQPPVQQATSA